MTVPIFAVLLGSLCAQDPSAPKDTKDRLDLAFWEEIKDKKQPSLFEAYLQRFPNGWFAPLAKARLEELTTVPAPSKRGSEETPSATPMGAPGHVKPLMSPLTGPELLRQVRAKLGGDAITNIRDWQMAGRTEGKNVFDKEVKLRLATMTHCSTGQTLWLQAGHTTYIDGQKTGWTALRSTVRSLSENAVRTWYADNFFQLLNLLVADQLPTAKIEASGERAVKITSGLGDVAVLEMDTSGVPISITAAPNLKGSSSTPHKVLLSNWREVKGILLPFTETYENSSRFVIDHWTINSGIACNQLAKPPRNLPIQPPLSPTSTSDDSFAKPEPGYVDRDTEAEAKELLHRVQAAVGGVDRIAGVRDYRRTFQNNAETFNGKERKGPKFEDTWCSSGAQLQRVSVPLHSQVTYFDGKNAGWIKVGTKVAQLKPPMIEGLKRQAFQYDFFGMLLADRHEGISLSLLGPWTLQIVDPDGSMGVLEIDPKTFLPAKRQTRHFATEGVSPVTEDRFLNWQEDHGLLLPRSLDEYRGERKIRHAEILEWKINAGTDCAALGKRTGY